jgi:hypothetical protein
MKTLLPALILAAFSVALIPAEALAATPTEKQAVFLICPKHKSYSAWSLYLIVDRDDPSKVRALGLEELRNKNASDSTYEDVLAAQNDPRTQRKNLGTLDVSRFGSGNINVSESDALHVSVSPVGSGALRLNMSMRISFDGRFEIGGKEENRRDVLFKYDPDKKSWFACADRLVDSSGRQTVDSGCLPLTGIVFPVTGTGIYRVIAATTNGDAVIVMDR